MLDSCSGAEAAVPRISGTTSRELLDEPAADWSTRVMVLETRPEVEAAVPRIGGTNGQGRLADPVCVPGSRAMVLVARPEVEAAVPRIGGTTGRGRLVDLMPVSRTRGDEYDPQSLSGRELFGLLDLDLGVDRYSLGLAPDPRAGEGSLILPPGCGLPELL